MSNSDSFDSISFVPFSQVVAALLDETNPFPITFLDRFFDISPADIQPLSAVWLNINPARRISLLESLEDLAEVDSLVSFNEIGRMALTDPEPDARAAALGLLCECADPSQAAEFIRLLETDDNLGVKVAAATALAQ
ncbi:MAG: HEAT repeat domain-containing protein, partial [Anaerolineaceae bacterium]|nr:HEAT repeat domain-containing protein [Anaerolineaceae bacterium]